MGSLKNTTQRLINISRGLLQSKRIPIIHRNYSAYDAEGKTMGKVLNKGATETLCVNEVGINGFVLSNQVTVIGPVIMFPNALLSWNIGSAADINEDSLSLFKILQPKVEMVIIGFGNREQYTRDVQLNILSACRKLNLNYEAMATEDAVATFNFLSLDHRFIAGAFLPPEKLTFFGLDKTLEQLEYEREDRDAGEIEVDMKRIPKLPPSKKDKWRIGEEEW